MQKLEPKPYWSPYLAGLGLGFTLIASYFILGGGLGASGAFSRITGALSQLNASRISSSYSGISDAFKISEGFVVASCGRKRAMALIPTLG